MKTFLLPDLGEGLQEAEILEWKVAVGDRVVADQPLATIETDKAIVEVPSPRAGRIAKLMGEPGDVIRVGAPFVEFAEEGGEVAADAGTIVGEIARTAGAAATPKTGGRRLVAKRGRPSTRAKAMPAVRDLASRLGVDLTKVPGTGPEGVVTSEDVARAAAGSGYEALKGLRRAMAVNMARAQSEVARTTVVDEADVEPWSASGDASVRLVRAIVRACKAEPALNAWYDGRAVGRIVHDAVHLGIAVDTADGLLVPVLRDAGALAGGDVRAELDRLRDAARARTLSPEELHGQTITLSNFGMLAGRFAALMVVPPQVAIVGAGRIARRAVAGDDGLTARRSLPLSVTFDHRAVTGGEAARFLATLIADLESVT